MANLGSYTRSAAQGTSSAYKALPIRWRLAGGSAALTLVILCGFGALVGVLTTRRIQSDFDHQVANAADDLARQVTVVYQLSGARAQQLVPHSPNLRDYAGGKDAVIRIVKEDGSVLRMSSEDAPYLGQTLESSDDFNGYRVENRRLQIDNLTGNFVYVQYARKRSDVQATTRRVKLFVGLGVFGGTLLALAAGVATARRAMAPIAELTDAAREIQRTRDPSRSIPMPEAEDEVTELARTLDGMLEALSEARNETQAMLDRQREFVADASHELRTPLTSVLANLELLVDELDGEAREPAESALRSSHRMRRLVADLLLLARADAGRQLAEHRPIDLARVVAEAAAELEPVAPDHEIVVAVSPAVVLGGRDELHRLVLNLMENAVKHTDAGTAVHAAVSTEGQNALVVVEDSGPGVSPELADRVFERFVRGASDHGSSSGLGLAIVRAVAEAHRGSVRLEPASTGRGARFVVELPLAPDSGAVFDGEPATLSQARS